MSFREIKKKGIVTIILLLMLSLNLTAFAYEDYSDVAEKDYFFVSVGFATEKGILNGVGNGRFSPWDNLTVAEAIKISACIHANFHEKDIHPLAGSNHWADVYHDYAVENGIIDETDFSNADFDNTVTRDRLFFILANTLPDSEYIAINETELAPQKFAPD